MPYIRTSVYSAGCRFVNRQSLEYIERDTRLKNLATQLENSWTSPHLPDWG